MLNGQPGIGASALAQITRRLVAAMRPVPSHGHRGLSTNGDVDDFLSVARQSFVRLQAAWDAADLPALAALTTEQLLDELGEQLAARGPGVNHTEVVSLDARLLAIEELQEAFVASVEFSGMIRERLDGGVAPFRELWLLANLKSAGRGWRLARVQALS